MREAGKKAKNDKEAERKMMSAITRLLTDPVSEKDSETGEAPKQGFRDPAQMFK